MTSVVCPKCGGSSVELLSAAYDNPGTLFSVESAERMKIYLYQCPCGMAFTVTRSHDESRKFDSEDA
jgi:predicted SprT family Zn-dependent metalloprotease